MINKYIYIMIIKNTYKNSVPLINHLFGFFLNTLYCMFTASYDGINNCGLLIKII